MAKIISMSLDEELLKELDSAKKSVGYSGRSEVIRSGMKLLLDDIKAKEKLKGHKSIKEMDIKDKKVVVEIN